jgi:hypothetical protein
MQALTKFKGDNWVFNPEDGALFGPIIDATVTHALGRFSMCGHRARLPATRYCHPLALD